MRRVLGSEGPDLAWKSPVRWPPSPRWSAAMNSSFLIKDVSLAEPSTKFRPVTDPDMLPVEYVLSMNLHRRHQDESRRAMVAAGVKGFYEKEAKGRQRKAGEIYGRGQKVPEDLPEPIKGDARDQAGAAGHSSYFTITENRQSGKCLALQTAVPRRLTFPNSPADAIRSCVWQSPCRCQASQGRRV